MSIQDSVGVYDQAEFADNPEARCSIVLIVDVSGSMGGLKIQTVNQALVKFGEIIKEDSVTALRADVAVIEFDHEARVVQDFTNGTDFEPPTLSVKGGTNYSKAVNLALDIIEARKQSYRDGGIAYYRSLAYFLTDGVPLHDRPDDLTQAASRLAEMEENRGVAFFSFLVRDVDTDSEYFIPDPEKFYRLLGTSWEKAREAGVNRVGSESGTESNDFTRLAEMVHMSPPEITEWGIREGVIHTAVGELTKLAPRPPVELTNMEQLDGSIQWLSRSVAAVSQSRPGDSIRLPQPDYLNF